MTMRVIWKFDIPLKEEFELSIPTNSKVLTVQTQQGEPKIWILVFPDNPTTKKKFRLLTTGEQFEDSRMNFIGTVQIHEGTFIGHIFEVAE